MSRAPFVFSGLMALLLTSGCETNQAGNTVHSAGRSIAGAAGDAAKGAVSLVNVDLSNVLNELALDLKVDKSNIPINAQIPVTVAANVCGVSLNVLSASSGGSPNCTANSTSPDLAQAVQQQLAANGSVGGGSQTVPGGTSSTSTSGTAGGTATGSTTPTGTSTSTGTGTSGPAATGTSATGTGTTAQQQTPSQ